MPLPVRCNWAVAPSKNKCTFTENFSNFAVTPVSFLDNMTPTTSWGVLLTFCSWLFSCVTGEKQSGMNITLWALGLWQNIYWVHHFVTSAHQNCPSWSQENSITAHYQWHTVQKYHIFPKAFPKMSYKLYGGIEKPLPQFVVTTIRDSVKYMIKVDDSWSSHSTDWVKQTADGSR